MGAVNKRGVWVPAAGDDLLAGWQTMAGKIGAFVPVGSVAAASAMLDEAQAAGIGASTANPILFLIGTGAQKVAYTADGSKTSGKWNLAPLNETGVAEDTFATGVLATLAGRTYSNLITSALKAAPYDRIITAVGTVYGQVTAGFVNARLWVNATDYADSRFDSGADDASCVSVTNSAKILANQAPSIRLGVVGDRAGSNKIQVASNTALNRLVVTAFPVSMTV